MAIIKKKELKAMGQEDLRAKLADLKKELFSMRAKVATTKTSENPGKYSQIKKTIARIKTYAHQRRLSVE